MIVSAEADREVGMEWYATTGTPCPCRVKASAEDFVVEELLTLPEVTAERRAGYYPLYRVEKRSIDTMHMAQELSDALKSRVSYGGLKDKRALAVQHVTPLSLNSESPSEIVRERFTARLVGYVSRPLTRAALMGNRFAIVLRDCCPEVRRVVGETLQLAAERRLPNFYGLQRFGVSGAGTHRIGRALVRREFAKAVRILLIEGHPSDDEAVHAAREAMAAGDYSEGARLLPGGKDIEKRVAQELGHHPGEWVRAMRAVPVKLRRLYVQAYQSMLFNRTLSLAMEKGEDISSLKAGDNWAEVSADGLVTSPPRGVRDVPKGEAVPMVQLAGYAHRNYGSRFDACLEDALEMEGVNPRQFYIEEMQEVSAEGGFRRSHLALADASCSVEGRTASLGFTLAKGQYATVVLREVIKASDPAGAGLA